MATTSNSDDADLDFLDAAFDEFDEAVQRSGATTKPTTVPPRSSTARDKATSKSKTTASSTARPNMFDQYGSLEQMRQQFTSAHGCENDGAGFANSTSAMFWNLAFGGRRDELATFLSLTQGIEKRGMDVIDVNFMHQSGLTPFSIAADSNHGSVVALLLDHERVDLNIPDLAGQTALFAAAAKGYDSIVAQIVACPRADVNAVEDHGQTALFMAASEGNASVVATLLDCGRTDLDISNRPHCITPLMQAAYEGRTHVVDMLASAGANLSQGRLPMRLVHSVCHSTYAYPEKKAAILATLKKHCVTSSFLPVGFQSKYYFADGEGKFYIRNLKYQRWLNRRTLLLALYRVYQWSLANQVEDDARRTLPPALSDIGKFVARCFFDVAGGGKSNEQSADTLGNGIGRLIMQFYGGFDASKSHFALRGMPKYGTLPDNAQRCNGCQKETKAKALSNCSSCGKVRYCGKECQKADWKRHKERCKLSLEKKKEEVERQRIQRMIENCR
jgi:hypothetical protein